jgi:alginate export protein
MKKFSNKTLIPLLASMVLAPAAFANESAVTTGVKNALTQSKVNLSFRGRYEGVSQDGKDDASALTVRSRLTVNTGAYNNFSFGVEVDNISAIVDDYNDLGVNYVGNEAVIADPEVTDINQAFLKYKTGDLSVKAGRQRINHDAQRFIGGVGWRQNEQTYDGYRFQYNATDKLNLDYTYVYNVNRIFGPDSKKAGDLAGDLHLFNGGFKINKDHNIKAFAYLLDFDKAAAFSTNTYGFLYKGNFGGVKLLASYATQSDTGANPVDYTADYYNLEAATKLGSVTLKAGVEMQGSDNGVAFKTPLATLHAWNGFADQFLSTPKDGLEDIYVTAVTKVKGVKLVATYHDFNSDVGGINYGSELDLVAAYKVNKSYSLLAKYANYSADEFKVDSDKLWLMVTAKF